MGTSCCWEEDNQKIHFNNNRNNNIYGASGNKSFANKETKIEKINSINFMDKKLRNIDNNGEEEELVNINNDKKLFEEFSKIKETITIASKKLEKLKKLISNYKEPILVGLNNIGANCYMNATLQCLLNTKKLTDYFLNDFKNDDPNKIMSNEYYKVLLNLCKEENNKKSYSPYSFKEVLSKENPLFAGISGNDSIDLINFLLERFHQELNITNKKTNNYTETNQSQTNEEIVLKSFLDEFAEYYNSSISNLFFGFIETKSQCKNCKKICYNFQIFTYLSFPLQEINQYFFNLGKRPLILPNGKNPAIELYECLEYYRKIELMTGENQMFCNGCKILCDSYYSTNIYSFPNYLIINLNRGKGAVYECNVIFPEQLNIKNYAISKQGITIYELYAVLCHLGPSSMSGHFVAYCKNNIDHKWYLYNDAFVTQCKREQQYKDGMPYILFYKASKEGI